MPFTIPTRALLLLVIIVPFSGILGAAFASWPPALIAAILRDGASGLANIPVEWGIIANLPAWIYSGSRIWGTIAWFVYGAFLLVGAGGAGLLGGRLWGWLVVKRFGWMTEEQVREFSKQEPRN